MEQLKSHETSLGDPAETAAHAAQEKDRQRVKSAKYSADLCKALRDFFSVEPVREQFREEFFASGQLAKRVPVLSAADIPTLEGFCREYGIRFADLSAWERKYPAFAEACAFAREQQKRIIITNALNGYYNASFAKFLLCCRFPEEFGDKEAQREVGIDISIHYGKNPGAGEDESL